MLGVVALPLIGISPPLPRIRDARFVLHTHPFPPSLLLRFHSPILPRLGRALPKRASLLLLPKASVGRADYVAEPATNVNFPKEMNVLGCSAPLVLLGTGYREKVFAIIGVKVYAAAFYVGSSVTENLHSWNGKSAADILEASSVFTFLYQAPLEKSLNIVLVRDVDGKTFWNALDDLITPRIKSPTAIDNSSLSTFRNTFQGRDLKQGTSIILTWLEPTKMLISISSDGVPSNVDAEITSANVNLALYDGFFGNSPVSPTLKASAAHGLQMVLR
ncbi:fatty-acid-binding protein 3, chloroplastic isoform X2 [Ananas comosus]|uniref:Chalcone-flavonone isomerase family protein n=1 Tax=Ananas comosus TaxID=4615 RepID=A0A6P5FVS2_ANACO|nr:fatty-acid-binding protein 3, chloroplastic isoform X2 [Ananas comosus]